MPDQQIAFRAEPTLTAALTDAAEATGQTVSDVVRDALRAAYAPGVDDAQRAGILAEARVRAAQYGADAAHNAVGRAVARDRAWYGIGSSYSLLRDVWSALYAADQAAEHRVSAFTAQLDGGQVAFTQGSAALPQVLTPGYQPIVLVADGDRPLYDLATAVPLVDAQPFTVPALVTGTGAVGAHVEGTNPTAGSMAVAGSTVSPRGHSGAFSLTREVADAANPALDAVAMSVMAEAYIAETEATVAAELAAQASAATTAAGTIAADLAKQVARMPGARRRRATAVAVTAADTIADACATGLDELSGDSAAPWHIQGVPVRQSPDLGSSTGQVAAAVVAPGSLWAWESQARTFRYDERSGPGTIELSLYAYFAARVLRPSGVRVLTFS